VREDELPQLHSRALASTEEQFQARTAALNALVDHSREVLLPERVDEPDPFPSADDPFWSSITPVQLSDAEIDEMAARLECPDF
jgi:hypothetical protein